MRLVAFATALVFATPVLAVTDTDKSFLSDEAQGSMYELAIAKLATTHATSPKVRAYSQKIVTDHEQANKALMMLAQGEGVTLPTSMSIADSARLEKLRLTSRSGFDKAYVDEVTRINADDEKSFAKEKQSTRDPKIKAYVAKFAAMDAKHKQMAEALPR